MTQTNDPKPNPLAILESPVFFGAAAVVTIVMVAFGWLDGMYGLLLLGLAGYGTFQWFRKRNKDQG